MRRIVLFSVLLLLILLACHSKKMLSKEELVQYPLDPEHGLIQKVKKGNTQLEIYYKPKDLILDQQMAGVQDEREIAKIKSDLDSVDYFVVQLSRDEKEIENTYASDPNRFNEVINYLSYYAAKDFKMITSSDTLPVLDLAYTRTFGSTHVTNILAVFNSGLHYRKGKAKIVFDDTVLGTGVSEFEFNINDIKNTPRLKTN
jgi:hypothetical protein